MEFERSSRKKHIMHADLERLILSLVKHREICSVKNIDIENGVWESVSVQMKARNFFRGFSSIAKLILEPRKGCGF